MQTHLIIPLALMGLFSVGSAYAMTNTQAKQLASAAYKRDTVDLIALESAAKSGDSAAQLWLGVYWGAKKDYAKANHWYEKAADQDNVSAENNLGNSYCYGQGVPQDYAEANHWYEKAADQGDAKAEYDLGIAYYHGQGVPQDDKIAVMWWKKVAAQGGSIGRLAQNSIDSVGRGIDYKANNYLSLVDLFNVSPYANKGKRHHIYFSKVVQSISGHDDLLDFQGSYYIAKFKEYAPQKGDFISGYCYGLGATQYQSVTNELKVVPHVLFYKFKAYNLSTPYGQKMSITLLKEQLFEGMSEISSNDTESKASISALHSLAKLSPNAADRAAMSNSEQ